MCKEETESMNDRELLGSCVCLCYVTRDQRSRGKKEESTGRRKCVLVGMFTNKAKSFKLELTKKHDEGQLPE